MTTQHSALRTRHFLRGWAVFALLVAVYFATYTGQTISTDEQKFYDGAHSLVTYGHWELNYTNDLRPYQTEIGDHINLSVDSEPMQMIASAPLIWLASKLDGIGLMQSAWLLNVFVTALTGMLLYWYGLVLGYSERASLITALLYGLGTYVWIYTQMYFREPLFTFFAVLCALGLEKWRRGLDQRHFHPLWLLFALLSIAAAFVTKEAALLLVPVMTVIALPGAVNRLVDRRVFLIGVALLVVIVIGVLAYANIMPTSRLASVLKDLQRLDFAYFFTAASAYLISPGFSVWAFSPVLLLAFLGAMIVWRQRRYRELFVPLVMLITYVLGYSLGRGSFWYGGAGWGPRFMIPTTPFLALLLLPVVESFLARRIAKLMMAVIVGLALQSVMTQVLAVTVPIRAFPNYLDSEGKLLNRPPGNELVAWNDGTWHPLYSPFVVSAHQATAPTEIAWWVNETGGIVLPLCIVAGGIAALVWLRADRLYRWRTSVGMVSLLAVSLAVMLYVGMRANYRDRRYGGDNPSLWTALEAINAQLRPTDVVILGNRTYRPFFMNYYRSSVPIYVLPNAQGEVLNIGETPFIVSTLPEEQVEPYIQIMLAKIAPTATRWWFLTEYTPFSTGRYRSTEHYMARHYFAGATIVDRPDVRVMLYAPTAAPPDSIPPWPQNAVDEDFGVARLVGYDLPHGDTIQPGTMLPISLLWRHDGWPTGVEPFNYSVNVSLIDSSGVVRAQRAEAPQGSFGQMATWQAGGYYRDNVALDLPPDLASGTYEVWVLIFDWRDNHKLPVKRSTGETADYVLLTKLTVN
ncbi:MAG: phospholipid carrier-dependent glycosyltransferase [Anaerolineae bacterium]|nr:phospholipid carrier-dependent glycosyltransferase [Anaerolineae bacterium]